MRKKSLVVIGLMLSFLAFEFQMHQSSFLEFSLNAGRSVEFSFREDPLAPNQIMQGQPILRSVEYSRALHGKATSGLWECIGPAEFVWHYGLDESIYILEGEAEITYQGRTFILKANQGTNFLAGSSAVWKVNDRVRKTWSLYEPGRLSRWFRRFQSPMTQTRSH